MATESILIRRTVAAPRERVFDAWCRSEALARWFFPEPGWRADVRTETRVGGHYRFRLTDTDGGEHVQEGRYLEIERPARLVFTWTCPELGVDDSLVTVDFADLGDRTEVVIRHELPPDPDVLRGHEGGWHGCVDQLDRYLADERPPHQG